MELNKQLVQAIQAEIAQARSEGLSEEDILWMATGAGMQYAREAGVVEDEDDRIELYAAIQAVAKEEMRGRR